MKHFILAIVFCLAIAHAESALQSGAVNAVNYCSNRNVNDWRESVFLANYFKESLIEILNLQNKVTGRTITLFPMHLSNNL